MASVDGSNLRKVRFRLHKQFSKTLITEEDALDFLTVAKLMERLYATGRARPEEVEI